MHEERARLPRAFRVLKWIDDRLTHAFIDRDVDQKSSWQPCSLAHAFIDGLMTQQALASLTKASKRGLSRALRIKCFFKLLNHEIMLIRAYDRTCVNPINEGGKQGKRNQADVLGG